MFYFTEVDQIGLRLVGGTNPNEGRVEVLFNGIWGTLCDDSWDIYDATIVCRQLGFIGADKEFSRAFFGEGSGPIHLNKLDCKGSEVALNECKHVGWGVKNCKHTEDAGVRCLNCKYAHLSTSVCICTQQECYDGRRCSNLLPSYCTGIYTGVAVLLL